MKKMFMMVAVFTMAMSGLMAGEFKISWNPDLETAKAQAILARTAKNVYWAAVFDVYVVTNSNVNITFNEFCSAVDAAIDKEYNGKTVEEIASAKILMKKQMVYCSPQLSKFVKEAYEFCKKNPTSYDFYYVAYRAKQIGLTDDEVYVKIVEDVLARQFSKGDYSEANKVISKIIDLSVSQKEDVAKANLKKLNRKFSPMLIADKTNWEPVVAKIRTAIDTY